MEEFIEFGWSSLENGTLYTPQIQEVQTNQEDEAVKIETFHFETLPSHLQLTIILKSVYKTYANLIQCSKSTNDVCKHITNWRFPHKVDNLYVTKDEIYTLQYCSRRQTDLTTLWQDLERSRAAMDVEQIHINCPLTMERCRKIITLFRRTRISSQSLVCTEEVSCDPMQLNELLEVLKCEMFQTEENTFASNTILQLPAVQKVTSAYIYNCEATNRELLGLRAANISLHTDYITSQGIAKYLNEWRYGKREIGLFNIRFQATIGDRLAEDMVEDNAATLVWFPEIHESTIIGSIPLEELDEKPIKYSIRRITPTTGEPTALLLKVTENYVTAVVQDPAYDLLSFLNFENFYEIRNECLYCQKQFCEHFGRFSLGRFRRAHPRILKSFSTAATIAHLSLFFFKFMYYPTSFDNAYLRYIYSSPVCVDFYFNFFLRILQT